MRYLVSYDISDPKDRDAVTSKLEGKDMGAKPVLESQWVLDKDNTNAEDICNELCNVTSRKKVLILVNTWDCSQAVYSELLCEREDIEPVSCQASEPGQSRLKRLFIIANK